MEVHHTTVLVEPADTDRDAFSTRELELRPEDVPPVASGFGTIATGLAPLIAIAAIAQAAGGFGNGENVAADTLIQRAVPREMLGRVFGPVSTAAFVGSTLAYAAGGPLLDLTSTRAVFLIAGAGILAVTTFLWFTSAATRDPSRIRPNPPSSPTFPSGSRSSSDPPKSRRPSPRDGSRA